MNYEWTRIIRAYSSGRNSSWEQCLGRITRKYIIKWKWISWINYWGNLRNWGGRGNPWRRMVVIGGRSKGIWKLWRRIIWNNFRFLKLDWSRNKWLNKKKRSKRCHKLIPLYKSKKIKLPLEPIFKRILRYLLVNTTMNGGIQSMMTLYMTSSSRKPNSNKLIYFKNYVYLVRKRSSCI